MEHYQGVDKKSLAAGLAAGLAAEN